MNRLGIDEFERLSILAEECAEVTMAVAKILRHGWESRNPTIEGGLTNRQDLEKEIGHTLNAIDMLLSRGDVAEAAVKIAQDRKKRTIGQWLHHQGGAR